MFDLQFGRMFKNKSHKEFLSVTGFLGNKLFLRDNRQNLCFLPMRNSIWIHLVISSNQLYIIKSVSKLFVHCLKLRHFILLVLTNSVWFWIRFRVTVLIFNFEKKLIALDRERYWFQRHIPSMYISFQLNINFWWCSKWFFFYMKRVFSNIHLNLFHLILFYILKLIFYQKMLLK